MKDKSCSWDLAATLFRKGFDILLSKNTLEKAKVKLDFVNDTAEILGTTVGLNETSSGHYCVPIDRDESTSVESVCAIALHELSEGERRQKLTKIHRQFAHPSAEKLIGLLKNAGAWRSEFQSIIDDIYKKCDICLRHKRTPSRPVVGMPMASASMKK